MLRLILRIACCILYLKSINNGKQAFGGGAMPKASFSLSWTNNVFELLTNRPILKWH